MSHDRRAKTFINLQGAAHPAKYVGGALEHGLGKKCSHSQLFILKGGWELNQTNKLLFIYVPLITIMSNGYQ